MKKFALVLSVFLASCAYWTPQQRQVITCSTQCIRDVTQCKIACNDSSTCKKVCERKRLLCDGKCYGLEVTVQ